MEGKSASSRRDPVSAARALDLLRGLVEIPSPTGSEKDACLHLRDQMNDLGMEASIDAIGNVVGIAGRGERTILLLGHIDTYPGTIPVRLEGDELWGRGAVDAKGALAAFALAASRFVEDPRVRIVVVGAVAEEGDSRGARFAAPRYTPAATIVGEPSGVAGITIGYKGSTKVRYTLRTPESHTGRGHATPAEEAAAFWQALAARYPRTGTRPAFDEVTPALKEIITSRDGLESRVDMGIDVRTPPGFDRAGFEAFLSSVRGRAKVEYVDAVDACLAGKRNPLVAAMLASMRARGISPVFLRKTGTADMNILAKAHADVPIVAYGPGDSSLDHTPHERVRIEEYLTSIEVMASALDRLATALHGTRRGQESSFPLRRGTSASPESSERDVDRTLPLGGTGAHDVLD